MSCCVTGKLPSSCKRPCLYLPSFVPAFNLHSTSTYPRFIHRTSNLHHTDVFYTQSSCRCHKMVVAMIRPTSEIKCLLTCLAFCGAAIKRRPPVEPCKCVSILSLAQSEMTPISAIPLLGALRIFASPCASIQSEWTDLLPWVTVKDLSTQVILVSLLCFVALYRLCRRCPLHILQSLSA